MDQRVRDQVLKRAPQRISIPGHPYRVDRPPHQPPVKPLVASQHLNDHLVERYRDPLLRDPAGSLHHQQVVDQPAQPLGVAAQVFEHLRIEAVPRHELDVAEQRGDRRPELVRDVGEKPALALPRGLE